MPHVPCERAVLGRVVQQHAGELRPLEGGGVAGVTRDGENGGVDEGLVDGEVPALDGGVEVKGEHGEGLVPEGGGGEGANDATELNEEKRVGAVNEEGAAGGDHDAADERVEERLEGREAKEANDAVGSLCEQSVDHVDAAIEEENGLDEDANRLDFGFGDRVAALLDGRSHVDVHALRDLLLLHQQRVEATPEGVVGEALVEGDACDAVGVANDGLDVARSDRDLDGSEKLLRVKRKRENDGEIGLAEQSVLIGVEGVKVGENGLLAEHCVDRGTVIELRSSGRGELTTERATMKGRMWQRMKKQNRCLTRERNASASTW